MYCQTCGDDDHYTADCDLRLGAPRNEPALLPQHARCYRCRQLIYAWDHMPCGRHVPVGIHRDRTDAPPVTPPRDRTHDLRALALQQAAEARAARLPETPMAESP
jgi:hypothetical protein